MTEASNEDTDQDVQNLKRNAAGLGVGGIAGYFVNKVTRGYLDGKLSPYDQEIAKLVRDDVLANKSGASGIYENFHKLALLGKPEFKFAKRVNATGGRETIALMTGIVTVVVASVSYFRLHKPQQPVVPVSQRSFIGKVASEQKNEGAWSL